MTNLPMTESNSLPNSLPTLHFTDKLPGGQPVAKLATGYDMPMVGFGTWQLAHPYEQTLLALELGYRHIDTAWVYGNEREIGRALAVTSVPRSEIFLTTKINVTQYPDAELAVNLALEKLGVDYLDLVLLHQPFGDVHSAWRQLERLVRAGKIRSLGVSNFPAAKYVDFYHFCEIKPVVNQVECHLFYQRQAELDWAQKYNTTLVAWSPLSKGKCKQGDFSAEVEAVLAQFAAKLGVTVDDAAGAEGKASLAQVLLAYQLVRGAAVIPKASTEAHMLANLQAAQLLVNTCADASALTFADLAPLLALDLQQPIETDHTAPEMAVVFYERHLSRLPAWEKEKAEYLASKKKNNPEALDVMSWFDPH